MLGAITDRYNTYIWGPELDRVSRLHRRVLIGVRLIHVLVRDLSDGNITMRATGLVYTTLVSLVPLLALAFSLLKAFGVDNALRPVLERFLSPLGAQSSEIVDKMVGFVQNVNVSVLGAVGMVTLVYSVVSLIQKIEGGCNHIWQVRQPRSLARRITEYLSVVIAGPLVILAASSMTAAVTSNKAVTYLSTLEPFGSMLYLAGLTVPYLLYSTAFSLLFAFVPNTHVRLLPAIGGGIFAGVLFQLASLAFAIFGRNAGNVNAIYSSFAILFFLLMWLYVSWLILLLGCRMAYLLQHTERLTLRPYPPRLGSDDRDELALMLTALIGKRFLDGQTPWNVQQLARHLRVAPDHVYDLVDQLIAAQVLVETGDSQTTLLPRRALDRLKLNDILDIIRRGEPQAAPHPDDAATRLAVGRWIQENRAARREIFADLTVRDLVDRVLASS